MLNESREKAQSGLGSYLLKSLKCAHWNVQSIHTKMDELTLQLFPILSIT